MRTQSNGDRSFGSTFLVPVIVAVLLLGLLGVLGILYLSDGGTPLSTVLTVFVWAAVGVAGLILVTRLLVLAAVFTGLLAVLAGRTAHAAFMVVRTALRGM